MSTKETSALLFWLLDTRDLWNNAPISETAHHALELLTSKEQHNVKSKYQLKDAKASLGSALLKRAFIARSRHVPWAGIQFSRKGDPKHGKPCYFSPTSHDHASSNPNNSPNPLFNISHQASLVALAGNSDGSVDFGVDIVCVNERDDYRVIAEHGFDGWVDIYTDVFSDEELWDMKYTLPSGTVLRLAEGKEILAEELGRGDRCCKLNETIRVRLKNGEEIQFDSRVLIEEKLRRFYAFWCLKEAYVKLVGEALLAKWLRSLEFRNVTAPKPAPGARKWGERVTDIEIWLYGKKMEDVEIELQAFEGDYMIGTAWKIMGRRESEFSVRPLYQMVHLERDVYPYARH